MPAELIPPGLLLMAAGLLVPFSGRLRPILMIGAPIAAIWIVWFAADGTYLAFDYAGYRLEPLRYDATARIFALVFAIAALGGAIFALGRENGFELGAALVYVGAALGAVLAGDLITLFVFWEVMAIASTVIVWCGGPAGRAAGLRYAAIHFLGGVLLMAGMAGEVAATGAIAFDGFALDSPARWLMLFGMFVNVAAWPLSAWVADAYPASSWAGMVFLSAFTTKAAVYALMRGFPGAEVLIFIGLAMILYGITYAILENDMRRMLAYSIVSQVGFMVAGIGIGSELALNGVAAHAFAHIVYKALLLMAAGAVLYRTGLRDFSEMSGLAWAMPWTATMAAIGALSISAAPLTSGFVSKSMIIDAAADGGLPLVWLGLTAASAGTALYAGFAFLWFGFFGGERRRERTEAPFSMRLAMALMAAICLGVGLWPAALYRLLPFPVDYVPYSAAHVLSQLQLILAAGVVFFVLIGLLARRRTVTRDVDWLWRGGGARCFARAYCRLARVATRTRCESLGLLRLLFSPVMMSHDSDGTLARNWSTGAMAFWAMLLLLAITLLNYL